MASRTTTDPIDILLEMGIDLDNLSEEEDYLSALKEAIAIILVRTKGAGNNKSKVLLNEVVKVRKSRKDKDTKFRAKKANISANNFKKGTARETASKSVGKKALPPAIKPKTSIIPYEKYDEVDDEEEGGKKRKAKTGKKSDKKSNLLEGIAKSVSNIADILKKQYGLKKKKSSNDAKKAEAERRKLKESGLEKRFKGLSKVAEKVIAPVKSVIDRILDFFLKIIVGRFLVKFIRWFGDPKNKKKVDSVVRFLVDHGPKLLAAFLLFGTGIGRFTVRLSALLIKGALRLGAASAKFAIGFARRHPAAAAITALVGGAALVGAMNKKDDAGSGGGTVAPGPGAETETRVAGEKYDPNNPTELQQKALDMSAQMGNPAPAMEQGGFIPNFFGTAKGAGSSIKEKGLGNAAMDFAGGALGGVKNFMDEKGISDVLMAHPLAKLGLLGFDKGKELLGGLTNFLNEKGIGDVLMQHPLAKMGAGFMNFGKDPARDITGESGQDVKGAGVDTQLISARPGDFVVNKKTASAMGPDYFDSISANTGEKVSGAGPDTQMIAVRPGEIVVNRETVGALGADHFLDLNRIFGGAGANKPKMAKVQAASGGGFVLPAFSAGGYVSGTDTGKRGTPDPKKLVKGQGGRVLGSTTQRGGGSVSAPMTEVEKIKAASQARLDKLSYEGKGKILSGKGRGARRSKGKRFDAEEKARRKEIGDRGGFLGQLNRSFTGMLDVLSGGKSRYAEADKASKARVKQAGAASIGRYYSSSDGKYYKDYNAAVKAREKRLAALKTSQATTKTTAKTLTKKQLLGKSGVMPTTDQLNATATKRHAELMKSTNQKKIADYDAKHGAGAYSKELKKKLNKTYSTEKAKQMTTGKIKPTGKVVGRENLSPQAQAAIARLESKKGLPPDMQYTRNGKRISADDFNRTKNMVGAAKEGGAKGVLNHMMSGAKNMFGGMFGGLQGAANDPKSFVESMGGTVKDGNKGIMSPEIQKDFEKLNANRAKADKLEAKNKMMSSQGGLRKNLKKDPLFAEYEKIQDDVNHPLHDKVAGDLFDDTGTKDPMRFADFKKFKSQQGQAKLSANQPSPASPPAPPAGGGNNVKVVRAPSPGGGNNPNDKQTGGSDVDATSPGNGNKAKWSILGIPMPF